MNDLTQTAPRPGFAPLDLGARPLTVQFAAVLLGTLVLAISSQISVPMVPVPVTMQTLAVTLIGALYGWRLGAITITAWLFEAALGLPVLANGNGSLLSFVGPTAGYLFAFPIVGAMVGWLVERGWSGSRPVLAFAAMLAGNALCLVVGALWLSILIGPEKAFLAGVVPFLLGGVLKSALGAAILMAFGRLRQRTQ
ncbi:biotin transporter BioY [Bosea sp. (in: a-proteobacteria)]|uniref:biotin transporter BioY n=1 Tax=Bosea sp. (in: a-proteobacteria) TaxID=1871050 RepID=UPI002FC74ECF